MLKEKYKDEKVLCIPNSNLKSLKNPHKDHVHSLLKAIKKHGYFDYRYNAEVDYTSKQVIPYVVLKCKDKYFVTQRVKGDSRLVGGLSIAVGGHVNPCDLGVVTNLDYPKLIVDSCMVRELEEETTIDFTKVKNKEYVTTFIDTRSDVSKVHVCLLVVIELEDTSLEIKETDKLIGKWLSPQEIMESYDKLEGWSQIAVDLLDIHE